MNYDQVIDKLGKFGTYQWIVFVITSFYCFVPGIDFMILIMATYTPTFNCSLTNTSYEFDENITIAADQCSYNYLNSSDTPIPCTSFTYDTEYFSETIVTEFNLVCDQAHHATNIQTVTFISSIAGNVIGYFGDKIGRQKIIFASVIWYIIVGVLIGVVPHLYSQYVLRGLQGFCSVLFYQGYILMSELTPANRRGIVGGNFWVAWCAGYMAAAGFGYFGRNWRNIKLFSLLPTVVWLLSFIFVQESPRWLLLKNRKNKAVHVLKRIARFNRVTFTEELLENIECNEEPTGKLSDLWKYKRVLCIVLLMILVNWAMICAYYGISMDTSFAVENIFLNTFFMGLVELPAGPLAGFVCEKFGRIKTCALFSSITAVCIITIPFIRGEQSYLKWIKMTEALIAKCLLTAAWSVTMIMRTEIIPVSLRNTTSFFIDVITTVAFGICPQILALANYTVYYIAEVIFTIQLVIAILIIVLLIPETTGLLLPDTAKEANELKRGNEAEWNRKKMAAKDLENAPTSKEKESLIGAEDSDEKY